MVVCIVVCIYTYTYTYTHTHTLIIIIILFCSMKHFMAVAVLTSMKSRDPRTQVGACIVKGDKVIGAGHNQMPNDHTEKYTWSRDKSMDNKYLYVCHAELNAILSSTDAKDCTIYVTLFPCSDCAKLLIQAGIKRVIYLSDKYAEEEDTKLSKEILRAKGIVFEDNKVIVAVGHNQMPNDHTEKYTWGYDMEMDNKHLYGNL
uniref:dCMP deaminase n=1 Tax=Periophthalmus magnuspinnatus TaxID=409849 RepID=A0A3B4AUJ4_9GOBI